MQINLITVIGYNLELTPQFLKHYENMVDNTYVIVYTTKDNKKSTLEKLEELDIKVYDCIVDESFNWYQVTKIYNKVKQTKPNDWWVVADNDEFQVYPESIETIINKCETNGYEFVTGGFLDRVSVDGSLLKIEHDSDLHKLFPLGGYFRSPVSNSCPNKATVTKGYIEHTDGQHYVWVDGKTSWGKKHPKRLPVEECFTQVHHFKWNSSVLDTLLWTSKMTDYYLHTDEFKRVYDTLTKNSNKIDITDTDYFLEKVDNFSYYSYSQWDILREKIILL